MNDDTISRQAAIDALKVAYWDNGIQSAKDDPCIVDAMTDWAIRQVKALPSAEPQRKRGHWVFDERAGGYFCSECGRETYDRHDAPFENPMFGKGIALVLPYYCGYCGAKMEGAERQRAVGGNAAGSKREET